MKRSLILLLLSIVFLLSVPCLADVFNLGPGLVNLETVTIGNAGNPADPETGFGSVGHGYYIGKYEITAGQYTDFLNHVAATDTYRLYNFTGMWGDAVHSTKIQRSGSAGSYTYSVASDWANRPVNYVSVWDAMRFANWLHHGQPTGPQNASTTEDGAYFLNGYTGQDGRTIYRKPGAKWFIPNENEWYKAAYYKGVSNSYWDYPMQSDKPTVPSNDVISPDPGNNANFYDNGDYSINNPYWRTNVGEYENSESHYGTFDQGGNIYEWNDNINSVLGGFYRSCRGGSWDDYSSAMLASQGGFSDPNFEGYHVGFRVAAIPEPSSLLILGSGLLALAGIIRKRNG